MVTEVPGPRSRALGARLGRVESRNITPATPIFWSAAAGAAVQDADGNIYVDLSAGFGVAMAGHANPDVAAAIARQAERLPHGLGDVYPPEIKVELLERLATLAPAGLNVTILGSGGAEAVEAALKTAVMHTGRTGVLAFEGGYHGLALGALAVTHRAEFRAPFAALLNPHVRFCPYPDGGTGDGAAELAAVCAALAAADRAGAPIGAIIAEPMLGRGGLVVPPAGFLAGLRALCDGTDRVLILDEIYTGFGRTGRWFACERDGVVPDILVVGKALTGSVPLSAAIGTAQVMAAWPPSSGEAIHTSTFLGNPVACAAALAQLAYIEREQLVARAAALGARIRARTEAWARRLKIVASVTGLGLLQGVRLRPDAAGASAALAVAAAVLAEGVIVLAEGPRADVLAITPPAVITGTQLERALDVIEAELERHDAR